MADASAECPHCPQVFLLGGPVALKNHLWKVHGISQAAWITLEALSESIGGPAKPSAECGICGAVFSLPESMDEHMTKAHFRSSCLHGKNPLGCLECEAERSRPDMVNSPAHYGGKDNPFEVIKVLRAWGLYGNAMRFNSIKYLARAGKKNDIVEDLKKAIWYINEEIAEIEKLRVVHFVNPNADPKVTACGLPQGALGLVFKTEAIEKTTCPKCYEEVRGNSV